jgi:hypothetical protein
MLLVSFVLNYLTQGRANQKGKKLATLPQFSQNAPLSLKNWHKTLKHLTEDKKSMNGNLPLITFLSVYGETTQWLYVKLTLKKTPV